MPHHAKPLLESIDGIEKHLNLLSGELSAILPKSGGTYKFDLISLEGAIGNLYASKFATQRVFRQRGGATPIVPLLDPALTTTPYWISIHQSWGASPDARLARLVYRTTSLTIYAGLAEVQEKLQLFRAEWPGYQQLQGGTITLEAPGAGHPHWQFDAYESRVVQVEETIVRLQQLGKELDEVHEVEDFSEAVLNDFKENAPVAARPALKLDRIHFASCANWAESRWTGDEKNTLQHARGPTDTSEVFNWVTSVVHYLQQELRR